MLRMENVSKSYRHRGQLVTALDRRQRPISPRAISSRSSAPAAAARARCC